MKILLITATYLPSANGVAISINRLFTELKKLGHEVYILAPNSSGRLKDGGGIIRYPSLSNPMVKDYPIPLLPINRNVIKLLTKEKFDIVHAHHPFYISFFADLVSTLNNVPFVFTHHTRYDEYIKTTLKFLPKKITGKIAKYTARRVYKNADVVVAPSNAIKKYLLKKRIGAPIEVIPTGLSGFNKIKPSKMELREKFEIPKSKRVLLCVSRLGEEKNILLLLKATKLLPREYYLVLVGSGPQVNQLEKYAKEHSINGKVKFVGKVPHERVSEYYKLSDIFVFPSKTETQGLALLEAAYFGLPTVAVSSDVNKEWIVKGAGMISKNNPTAFKSAILEVGRLDREIVKKRSKEFAKKHTSKRMAKEMVKLYENAIRKGRRKKTLRGLLAENSKKLENYLERFLQG